MTETRIAAATQAQIAAALPKRSAWVAANAGSGKTRVLTNRVARLLLQGTEPAKILCLTFTNAGAAEMQNRLFKQLGEWAMLPDKPLREKLAEMGELDLPASLLLRARSLFARALETPGGLKIQTIHAFCESLLHRFPLEAQVSPEFELLDERQSKALKAEVLNALAEELPETYAAFIRLNGDPEDFLYDILKFQQLFSTNFDEAKTAEAIGVEIGLSEEIILAKVLDQISDSQIDTLATAMAVNDKGHDLKTADTLKAFAKNPVSTALNMLEAVFLTKGQARKTTSFPNQKTKTAFPQALELVSTLIDRVYTARQSRLGLAALEKAKILHAFATAFLLRFSASKATRGALEFEDLIRKAVTLLRKSDMAQWVLYRLDGGVDHILVDEAQDTSPLQWDIVMALVEEIYATSNESNTPRTVFVVGDEKQSIFSFQGAEPHEFSRIKALLHERMNAANAPMYEGSLLCSFRSASTILQLVDKVFESASEGGIQSEVTHISAHDTLPGRVEVWPYYEAPDKPEKLPWDAPVDALPGNNPVFELARDMATRVAEIIASGQLLPGKNRPIQAGDFLILVQSRKVLFKTLLKELKAKGVPVAGADRLKVLEELAVKDLLSVLKFADNPHNDLNLANALRSPLCGATEQELFSLAHGREGSLWQAVRPHEMLSDILGKADYERPFELLERILIKHKGREKLLGRLGPEAQEGVDELLRQALEYERSAAPSLTGFLEWIGADELEVKRQFNNENNLLRIMTVHGAKGLEAPIVILPQTVKKPNNSGNNLLILEKNLAVVGASVGSLPESLASLRDKKMALQSEERMRLLYVALTRAESWLIIAGVGKTNAKTSNWYEQIYNAAEELGGELDTQNRMVLQNNWKLSKADIPETITRKTKIPDWLHHPAPEFIKSPRPLAPSSLGGAHTIAEAVPQEDALLRGTQIHILLESLAGLPDDARDQAAQTMLDEPLNGVINEALKTLRAPALAHIFGQNTLYEVPVNAVLKVLGPISGKIDVLVVGETILAVDFKSNPQVPHLPEDIPEGFLRQMGAYRAALAQIWPERDIEAAICWTHNQSLMRIPSNLSDAALKRAASA